MLRGFSSSLATRLLASMPSRRRVVGGKLVALLEVKAVLPWCDADEDRCVIRQMHNRREMQTQNIQSHASERSVASFLDDPVLSDY
jgi:hypothetical protein